MAKSIQSALSAVLIITTLFTILSCSRKQEKNEIRFMYWGGTQEIVTKKKMIARFEKENPDITVISETVNFGSYFEKLLINLTTGTAADVILLPENVVSELTTREALVDLAPFISADNERTMEELIPTLTQEFSSYNSDGKVFVVPNQFFTGVTYFNQDLFEFHGVELPKEGWTWSDASAMARKMTTLTGEGGKRKIGIASLGITTLGHNADEPIYSADGKKCLVNNPRWVALGKFLVDVTDRQRIVANAQDRETQSGYEGFLNGTVAMLFGGQYMAAELALRKQTDWGVAPMPRFKNSGYAVTLGLHGLAISRDSKRVDLAWKFLKFMESQAAQKMVVQLQINLPANNKSFIQAIEAAPAGFDRMNLEMAQKSLSYAKKEQVNNRISASELNVAMKNFDRAFASGGGVPVEKVLNEIADEINHALLKNRE